MLARRPPTARQVYAIAAAFCVRDGYAWPADREEASDMLGELRREIGHPRPELENNPVHPPRPKPMRREEWDLHREIADTFLQARRTPS